VKNTDNLLLDGLFLDQTGWAEDYRYDLSGEGGQPPSIYSHNVYVQHDSQDVTFRDSITMRGAAFGAQIRPGGFIEDNVFLDNNAALNMLGGDSSGLGPGGQYSVASGNLVTSAGHRDAEGHNGGLSMGIINNAYGTALIDNIVAHLADPENAAEQEAKTTTHQGLDNKKEAYYDDTILYNWIGSNDVDRGRDPSPDLNTDGLNPDTLDDTTIQNFAAELLNDPNATIADLANYLRGIADGTIDDDVTADDIIAYFRAGFGVDTFERVVNGTMRFTPDDRGEGFRWDNRLNWNEEQTPINGDNVELGGNWVVSGGTVAINDLDMGDGGALTVNHGKLSVTGELTGGTDAALRIESAGQFWVEDYHDTAQLDIDVDGGRFANTGFFDGLLDMDVTDGQALLGVDGSEFEIGAGSSLTIHGDDARVGFDGEDNGIAVLRLEDGGRLEMIADSSGFATIEEFRSGAFDQDDPGVLSAVDMGKGTLMLDISALGGGAGDHVLVHADEIAGVFDTIEIVGLGSNRDATLNFDYEADQVVLSLGAAGQGSGAINLMTTGEMTDTDSLALWEALTEGQGTYEDMDLNTEVNGQDYDEDDFIAA
jgi:hypothetical protein